jgi:guanyl-specific ribonuclease Sa
MLKASAWKTWIGVLLCALLFAQGALAQLQGRPQIGEIRAAELPREAHDTLALIRKGGPYPHRQDGVIFRNRERILAIKQRDYYREYTVKTPGSRDRGARRIVTGGTPPVEFFYTDDHYRSFKRIRE